MVYQRMADDSANSVVATHKGALLRGKPLLLEFRGGQKPSLKRPGRAGVPPTLPLLRSLLLLTKDRTMEAIQSREIGDDFPSRPRWHCSRCYGSVPSARPNHPDTLEVLRKGSRPPEFCC